MLVLGKSVLVCLRNCLLCKLYSEFAVALEGEDMNLI